MSDETKSTGLDNAGVLWSSRSNWLLDDPPPEKNIAEIDTDSEGNARLDESGGKIIKYKQLKPLTLREELFVREYCKDFDSKRTAKALDIPHTKVLGLISRENVKAAVHKKAMDIAKASDMDQQWVLRNIRDVVERCMGDQGEGKFDPAGALRGLELVGKYFAMFTDKVEKSQTTVIRIESNVGFDVNNLVSVGSAKVIEIEKGAETPTIDYKEETDA